MSKGLSPWSVVTTILSPSKKRREKPKDKKVEVTERSNKSGRRLSAFLSPSHKVPEIPNHAPACVTEVKTPVVDISSIPPSGGSLPEDPSFTEAAPSAKVSSDHEHEWTDVAPQKATPLPRQSPGMPSSSSPVPHVGDESIDIVSAPPSTENSDQQQQQETEREASLDEREEVEGKDTESLTSDDTKTGVVIDHQHEHGDLSEKQKENGKEFSALTDVSERIMQERCTHSDNDVVEIGHRVPEIVAIDDGKKQLQDNLADTVASLADSRRKNTELEEANQRQLNKIQVLESTVQALELEKSDARRAADAEEELESNRQEAQTLRADLDFHKHALQLSENRIENALKELVPLESKIQGLNEENRSLLGHKSHLETTVRILETEKSTAVLTESRLRSELEETKKRSLTWEDRLRELTFKMLQMEEDKATAVIRHEDAQLQWLSETESLRQKLKALDSDKEDLMAGLKSAMQRNRELEDKETRHASELQSKELQLQEVRENYATVTTQIQASLETALRKNDEIQTQMRRQTEERRAVEQQLHEVKAAQAEVTKQPNQRQLERFERQNRMLVDQIRRQSEIIRRPRQVPPSSPTLKEDTEVIALVKKLNLEIFQTAAHMADSLSFTGARSLPAHRTRGVVDRATLTMGRPMVLALTTIANQAEPDFNPLPVQFGIQACLVRCCERIVSSWYPGHWEYGEFLSTIYSRIQESGSKIASKWRTVTQAQIKQPADSELQTTMRGFLQANLVDALIVAGWYDSQTAAQETFMSFRERLAQIVKLALRLNSTVGEEWENIVILPSEHFEPDVMENAYDGEDLDDGQRVVCTTGLGLRSVSGEIVIKPQVILRSTLREETGYSSID